MMRIQNQDEILQVAVRKAIIDEIKAPENQARKAEYRKRYEIYKDQTKKYVLQALAAEGLLPETIAQMSNRAGNISICRKIVNKKARAYSGGVQRSVKDEKAQGQVSDVARLLQFDQKMKKADRYRELHRNCVLQVVPELDTLETVGEAKKYRLKMSILAPWQYDAVEDFYDREQALAFVISDYVQGGGAAAATSDKAGVHPAGSSPVTTDRKDNVIADAPADANMGGQQEFIWWTARHHFTTDDKGEIIVSKSPEGGANPIGLLPMVNNAEDQDGQFWAIGGDDLIDGSILVNKKITDMNYIAYLQGFGQWVVTGENISDAKFKFGPNNCLLMDYKGSKDEPAPTVEVLSANPPLGEWRQTIEQYMALLLTTNNLSPSNVSGALSAQSFPSGIAILIEQSESTDDVVAKQQDYVAKERMLWKIIGAWLKVYSATSGLCGEFAAVGPLPDDLDLAIRFNEAKPAITEAERLENIKRRKELGINTMIDLIKLDNPDMTDEEAEEKLLKILEEKLKRSALLPAPPAAEPEPRNDENDDGDTPLFGGKKPDDEEPETDEDDAA